jgi:glycosyltransferase involved in cell wall biosynthesis
MVFPGGPDNGFSSGLRGWQLAAALNKRGYRALVIPPQLELEQRQRLFRLEKPDIVFFQMCRDKWHHPDLFPGAKYVLDLDDADFLDPKLRPMVQEVAAASDGCIAGSRFIADWLKQHCTEVEMVWTGSPLFTNRPKVPPSQREHVVVWAVSNVLAYRREAELVRDVALSCAQDTSFVLRIQGGGNLEEIREIFSPVEDAGVACEFAGYCNYKRFVKSLETASVGLAPLWTEEGSFSTGKSFGKVLAYLAADVPVVASNAVDHPIFFKHGMNGFLAQDVDEWAWAIRELILSPELRDAVASEARADSMRKLTVAAASIRVSHFLDRLIAGPI